MPRRPKVIHYKVEKNLEKLIVTLRKQTHFSALRLKDKFNIPLSVGTIYRVLKDYGLINRRRKKYLKKICLREEKQKLCPFQVIQVDIKQLDDISHFYKYYYIHKLPRYQITARDVKTGMLFFFYTYEKSTTSTIIAMKYLLNHLSSMGVNLKNVTNKTDKGSEF